MRLTWRAAVVAVGLTAAPATAEPAVRPGVWAQSYVGRHADPAVTFGTLPNGMRFAVMANATPRRQVSVRLVIGSGSLAERDDQRGLAHFVEHMAFRGSSHVPDGELMRTLERKGLAIGADSNAFTTQEATFYQFDLPENDAATVATGLRFLRETASEVSFAAPAVAGERAVVLAEERARDSPQVHSQRAAVAYLLAGHRTADRWPIGTREAIARASVAQLREFYTAHYRPANATVIVVGDVDPAVAVAEITAQFAGWTAAGPASSPLPVEVPLAPRTIEARLFTEAGVSHAVEVTWLRPFDDTADSAVHRRDLLLAALGVRIFNQRLLDIALGSDPPFLSARIERGDLLRTADITSLDIRAPFAQWQTALAATIGEQRRMLEAGVTPAELARVIAQMRTALTTATAGAATRPTPALAGAMVAATIGNLVFVSPAQNLAEFEAALPTIDIAAVNAAFRAGFAGSGPLLLLTAAGPVPDGEARLRAAFAAAATGAITAAAPPSTRAWPYTDFGAPGRIVARRILPRLGVTQVDFANGAVLLVKPTAFAKDAVEVDVRFGHGRAGLPPGREPAYWTLSGAMPVVINGGTGKLSATDLARLFSDRVVGADLSTGDAAFDLRGRTRPADLQLQLQLLTAYLSDPGFRLDSFARLKTVIAASLPQLDSDPGQVLYRALPRALHDGDSRWETVPGLQAITDTWAFDPREMFTAATAHGKLGVVVAGDVDVEAAIKAVAATIGALPPRADPALPPRTGVRFPVPVATPVIVAHHGRPDKAIAVAAWPATDFYANPRDVRALLVTMALLRSRLTDRMRGADGLTYSPEVDGSFSNDFDGYGNVVVRIELAPDRIDEFYAKLDTVVRDLGRHEPTPDELVRAKAPVIEARTHDLENNGYWTIALARATRDARELPTILERISSVEAVTAADVRRVALAYLQPERTYRLAVRPATVPIAPLAAPQRDTARPCSNTNILICRP